MKKFAKKSIIILVLAIICACFAISPMGASYARSYDFSPADGSKYKTLTASDVIESAFGTPDEVENEFLSGSAFILKYGDGVGSPNVSLDFDEASGKLSVVTTPYNYESVNGENVTWVAKNVTIGGRQLAKNGDMWTCDVQSDDGDLVETEFTTDFIIDAADINAFANSAYNAAKHASETIGAEDAEYERRYGEYLENLSRFEQYEKDKEKYERDIVEYEKYVSEYKKWEQAKKEYDDYLAEYNEYIKELDFYENYEKVQKEYLAEVDKYNKYLSDHDSYIEKMKQYEAQMDSPDIRKAQYQLSVLAYMDKPVTEMDRTLSGAILGNAVTQVLGQREALKQVVEEEAIDRATEATFALRTLIEQYHGLTNDASRYMFYITSYGSLSANFNDLLRVLDYLYGFPIVSRQIKKMERIEQFEILLAQLYYICNALSDKRITNYIAEYTFKESGRGYFDGSYMIGADSSGKRSPASILGADGLLEDRDSVAPLPGGWPEMPELPVEPQRVEPPTPLPPRPSRPVPPDTVNSPGDPPATVEQPTMPSEVKKPTMPKQPVHSQKDLDLKKAYDDGRISYREPLEEAHILTVSKTVRKYFRNVKMVSISFYESEQAKARGDKPVYHIDEVPLMSEVQFEGALPQKSRLGYKCVFDHWVDKDGEFFDLENVQTSLSDVDLFPRYVETPLKCNVIWYVNGAAIRDACDYDSSPFYDQTVLPPIPVTNSDGRGLRLLGWRDIGGILYDAGQNLPVRTGEEALTKTAYYTAVFKTGFFVEWLKEDGTLIERQSVWDGEMPQPPLPPVKPDDNSCRYEFAGWGRDIEEVHADTSYRASYEKRYFVGIVGEDNRGGTVERSDSVIAASCYALEGKTFDISMLIDVARENNAAIRIQWSKYTLQIPVSVLDEADEKGLMSFVLTEERKGYKSYGFEIKFINEAGEEIALSSAVSLTIRNTYSAYDTTNSYLSATDGKGNSSYARFVITENELTFSISANVVYLLRPLYAITITPCEFLDIVIDSPLCEAYQEVSVTLKNLQKGMKISSVFVRDDKGNDVVYSNTSTGISFTMPRSGIVFGVACDLMEYKVVFKADGMVLISRTMHYGDTIIPPDPPTKASDGEYEYSFVGWDKQLGTVTGDMEFNAVFESAPLVVPKLPQTTLGKFINAMYIVLPVTLVAIAAAVVAIVIVVRRRKRRVACALATGEEGEVTPTVSRGPVAAFMYNVWTKIKAFFAHVWAKTVSVAKVAWSKTAAAFRFVWCKIALLFKRPSKTEEPSDKATETEPADKKAEVREERPVVASEITEKPVATVEKSAAITEEPVVTTEKPATITEEPVVTTEPAIIQEAVSPEKQEESGEKAQADDRKPFIIYIRKGWTVIAAFVTRCASKLRSGASALISRFKKPPKSMKEDEEPTLTEGSPLQQSETSEAMEDREKVASEQKEVEISVKPQKNNQSRPNITRKGNGNSGNKQNKKHIIIVQKGNRPDNKGTKNKGKR